MTRISRNMVRKIWPWVVLFHAVLFLAFWLTNSLFYSSTNDYLAKMLGRQLDYINILLWGTAFLGTWSAARLLLTYFRIVHRLAGLTDWLYGLIGLVYIVFFYGSFWLLFRESPVQIVRIRQLLNYYRLILDPALFLGVIIVLGIIVRRLKKRFGRNFVYLPGLVVLVALWIVPVVISPGSVYKGALPTKPLVIAHRGASMLAPENTIASAELASSLGVFGIETDIHISSDGVPFLMHDDTLFRTTDAGMVFPDRSNDRAEYFSMAEISQLNAGTWFVNLDPFHIIADGQVSIEQIEKYKRQPVPTLTSELDIVKADNLVFIFDLKQPPADQPYSNSFFRIVFDQIKAAEIDPQVWFLVNSNELSIIKHEAPTMRPVYGVDFQNPPSVKSLTTAGYQIVNSEYGLAESWIRAYQQAGLWINLYTIDESWQYSRLWILGVDSTTTSNASVMMDLKYPILGMPYSQYLLLWSTSGIISLLIYLAFGFAPKSKR